MLHFFNKLQQHKTEFDFAYISQDISDSHEMLSLFFLKKKKKKTILKCCLLVPIYIFLIREEF